MTVTERVLQKVDVSCTSVQFSRLRHLLAFFPECLLAEESLIFNHEAPSGILS
jgi:hypothetical protein